MAILPAAELESLGETAYLLRSPKNARRLLRALGRAMQGEAKAIDTAGARAELGLTEEDRSIP